MAPTESRSESSLATSYIAGIGIGIVVLILLIVGVVIIIAFV